MATKKTTKRKTTKKPSTKKKASKSTTKKTTAVKTPVTESNIEKKTSDSKNQNHKRFFIPLAIILLVGLVYFIANQFVVATVNYRPITRLALYQEMESQIGQQTLETLIIKQMIIQEAQKQGVTVAQDEIDEEIGIIEESLEAQGQNLEDALAFQGLSMDDLESQLKLQLLVNKLVSEPEISDEEVDEFVDQQRAFLEEGADETQIREDAREFLKQQKQAEAADELVNSLRTQASVKYFGSFSDNSQIETELPQ